MIMRTDPFAELDRWAQQLVGHGGRPSTVPMDAWRAGEELHVELDLPGIDPATLDLDVQRTVLTVTAERPVRASDAAEVLVSERPRGTFRRQLVLGDALDPERATADYRDGVLHLTVPVSEKAKPRKIQVSTSGDDRAVIEA
ncbi:Hsp20/alpha crystallin family protein [Rhodococcus aerolatus]